MYFITVLIIFIVIYYVFAYFYSRSTIRSAKKTRGPILKTDSIDDSDQDFVNFSIEFFKRNYEGVRDEKEKRNLVIAYFDTLKLNYVFSREKVLILNNKPITIEKIIKGWI